MESWWKTETKRGRSGGRQPRMRTSQHSVRAQMTREEMKSASRSGGVGEWLERGVGRILGGGGGGERMGEKTWV